MPFVDRLGSGQTQFFARASAGEVEPLSYIVVQSGVVVHQGENVVTATIDDSLSDAFLAVECIGCDDVAFDVEPFRDSRYLVGLAIHRLLAEQYTALVGERAHQMQPAFSTDAVSAASRRLAIQRDDLSLVDWHEARHPLLEARLELGRFHQPQHSSERVVRRNPVRKR